MATSLIRESISPTHIMEITTSTSSTSSHENEDRLSAIQSKYSFKKSIPIKEFVDLLPELRLNYVEKKNQTKLCVLNLLKKLPAVQRCSYLLGLRRYDDWDPFTYMVTTIILRNFGYPSYDNCQYQLFLIKKVMSCLKAKEFLSVGMELLNVLGTKLNICPKIIAQAVFTSVVVPESSYSVMSRNTRSHLIPEAKKIWGKTMLRALLNMIPDDEYLVFRLVLISQLNGIRNSEITFETFIPYYKESDMACRIVMFESLCKVRKSTYLYNIFDFKFILDFITSGDPAVIIRCFPYFYSHIYQLANSNMVLYGNLAVRITMTIHDLSFNCLMGHHGADYMDVGGLIYHAVHQTLVHNKVKNLYSYEPVFERKGSPLYALLNKLNKQFFGRKDDVIQIATIILNANNVMMVAKVLREIPKTADFIKEQHFLDFIFNEFVDTDIQFYEEKLKAYVDFLIVIYHNSELSQVEFFNAWLGVWLNCNDIDNEINLNLYFSLRVILYFMNLKQPSFFEVYIQYDKVIFYVDELVTKCKRHAKEVEIKQIEKILIACAELLVGMCQRKMREAGTTTIHKVLSILESIINCNMCHVTATVAILYKDLVTCLSPLNIEFFREYLSQKISLIDPKIARQSKLRRGAEHRAVIHSICAGLPKSCKEESLCTTVTSLLVTSRTSSNPETIATAIHCINQLVEDSSLRMYTEKHIFTLFLFCLEIKNKHFLVNNATYLLFKTVTSRILPSVDRKKNLPLNDLFWKYPQLYEMTLQLAEPVTYNQNTQIMLLSFLKSASENNFIPSESDYQYQVLPVCSKKLNLGYDMTTVFVLDLFNSIIPVHDVPTCYIIILSYVLDNRVSTQLFYSYVYILNELSEKLILHIEFCYCDEYIKKWEKMQVLLTQLKHHEQFNQLLQIGLISNTDFDMDNLTILASNILIVMYYSTIPKCLSLLRMFTKSHSISITVKLIAAEILLKRIDKSNPLYDDCVSAALILALTVNPVNQAQNLIVQLIHILGSHSMEFSSEIRDLQLLPYESVLKKTLECTKYIFLYTQILSYLPETHISSNTKRLILDSFYIAEDEEVATVFQRLNIVVNDRTEILLISLYILTLTDHQDRYVCQSIYSSLFGLNIYSFKVGIEMLFSRKFLCEYLRCQKSVSDFLVRSISLIKDINAIFLNTSDFALKKQYELCCESLKKLFMLLLL